MWYDPLSVGRKVKVSIALKQGATPLDQLTAWWHAMALAEIVHAPQDFDASEKGATILERSMKNASEMLSKQEKALQEQGWDLATGALETGSNPRLMVSWT